MSDPEPIKSSFEPNLLIEFVRPPFRRFELFTPMTPARAAAVLQKIVEPNKNFRSPFSKKHRYFEGSVDGDHFKISRIINYYRNSFVPIIEGSFRPEPSGTIVSLNLRMAWPVTMLWVVMILLPLLSFVANGSQAWVHGPGTFLIKMTLFIYFMASVCFAIEARIAMKTLRRLLRSGDIRGDRR
jgi:hypothetical protein